MIEQTLINRLPKKKFKKIKKKERKENKLKIEFYKINFLYYVLLRKNKKNNNCKIKSENANIKLCKF